jgi:spore germination cell wall hydrolase CwlJ-like protein
MLPAVARIPALRLSMMLASLGPLRRPRFSLPKARHALSTAVLATMAGLYLIAGLSVTTLPSGGEASARARLSAPQSGKLVPQAEPLQFRLVAPETAIEINAAVPIAEGPNPAAAPFRLRFATPADKERSVHCLTMAIYYEAATEPLDGQRAVAQVILNRVRHPAYPTSVCGVVFQGSQRVTGCQFTFTCDGSLRRAPMASYWQRARQVAEWALAGKVYAPVGWATHYHTNWVVPYWSSSLTKLAVVGTHIFYRWEGGWGKPRAFSQSHSGVEPDVSMLGRRTAPDPALAVVDPTDAAAVAAAAAAAAEAGQAPASTSVDSFNRAVIRRYEPLTKEKAAAVAIERTGEPASQSLRWSLGAAQSTSTAAPLGRKPAAPAVAGPKEPVAAPKCLDGVRRVTDKTEGAAETQRC